MRAGGQHGLNQTGRDEHAGGDGQIGFHEHVGLRLAGKHGEGQSRTAGGKYQTGQHCLGDGALPHRVRRGLARVLRNKVQPAADRTDERQGDKPASSRLPTSADSNLGMPMPPPTSWPSSR